MGNDLLAIVGSNDKGPINEPVIIDSNEKLIEVSGKPFPEEAKKTKTQRIMDFLAPPDEPEVVLSETPTTSSQNPKKWIKMTDNGSNYYIPAW